MKKYNELLNNKGFTLIEAIVTLTILLVISTSFLTLFTSGYKNIFLAGQKTDAVFKVQEVMENHRAGVSIPSEEMNNITILEGANTDLNIDFGVESIKVNGKSIRVRYEDDNRSVEFGSFISKEGGD